MNNISQLHIEHQYPKIGMRSKRAELLIQQPKAKIDIHQEQVKVEIRHKDAKVLIDQSSAWAAYGKIPPVEESKNVSEQYKQIGIEAIGKIAEDGDQLAAIQNKQDPIPELAKEDLFKLPEINYLGEASSLNVRYDVIPGSLDMKWHGGKTQINVSIAKPIITYTHGKLDIYLLQKDYLKISFSKVDKMI